MAQHECRIKSNRLCSTARSVSDCFISPRSFQNAKLEDSITMDGLKNEFADFNISAGEHKFSMIYVRIVRASLNWICQRKQITRTCKALIYAGDKFDSSPQHARLSSSVPAKKAHPLVPQRLTTSKQIEYANYETKLGEWADPFLSLATLLGGVISDHCRRLNPEVGKICFEM